MPVAEPPQEIREMLAKGLERDGKPLDVFRTLAHHPKLLKRFILLGAVFLTEGLIPPRERELVILRVGRNTLCEYEFGQHTMYGLEAGLAASEVARVAEEETEGWGSDDRALLAMTDELCAMDTVSDETWRRLSQRWNESELLELIALIGYYRLTAGILNAAQVQREPGIPGWPRGVPPTNPTDRPR